MKKSRSSANTPYTSPGVEHRTLNPSEQQITWNKLVMRSTNLQDILDLIINHVNEFDYVNVSTIMSQLVKRFLDKMDDFSIRQGFRQNLFLSLHLLLDRAKTLLETKNICVQGISNICWSVSKLFAQDSLKQYLPRNLGNTLKLLIGVATEMSEGFQAQNISNFLWGIGRLRVTRIVAISNSPDLGIETLCSNSSNGFCLDQSSACFKGPVGEMPLDGYQDVTIIPHKDISNLVEVFGTRAVSISLDFSKQHIANILWSLSRLSCKNAAFIDVLMERCLTIFQSPSNGFDAQNLSNIIFAFVVLDPYQAVQISHDSISDMNKLTPNVNKLSYFIRAWEKCALAQFQNFNAMDVSYCLWSLAYLNVFQFQYTFPREHIEPASPLISSQRSIFNVIVLKCLDSSIFTNIGDNNAFNICWAVLRSIRVCADRVVGDLNLNLTTTQKNKSALALENQCGCHCALFSWCVSWMSEMEPIDIDAVVLSLNRIGLILGTQCVESITVLKFLSQSRIIDYSSMSLITAIPLLVYLSSVSLKSFPTKAQSTNSSNDSMLLDLLLHRVISLVDYTIKNANTSLEISLPSHEKLASCAVAILFFAIRLLNLGTNIIQPQANVHPPNQRGIVHIFATNLYRVLARHENLNFLLEIAKWRPVKDWIVKFMNDIDRDESINQIFDEVSLLHVLNPILGTEMRNSTSSRLPLSTATFQTDEIARNTKDAQTLSKSLIYFLLNVTPASNW